MNEIEKLLEETDNPERLAYIIWSTLCEPGDPLAGLLRKNMGALQSLRWVMALKPDLLPLSLFTDLNDFDAGDAEVKVSLIDTVQPSQDPAAQINLAHSPGPEIGAKNAGPQTWKRRHSLWHERLLEAEVIEDLHRISLLGGRVICPVDRQWPVALSHLGVGEPAALWVLGAEQPLQLYSRSVSIIGARACTAYGKETAANFAYAAAEQKIAVVSGGAYGIDASAHKGALGGKGATLVVLCGGVGRPYPRAHAGLFTQIVQAGGAVISEVPPHWRPARWRFLERNRIIAALSAVTLVVEAGLRSGAIATAHRALELGREVGAVPGPISSPVSAGCNRLILEGAALVAHPDHVTELLEETSGFDCALGGFVDSAAPQNEQESKGGGQSELIDLLGRKEAVTLHQLATKSGLSIDQLQTQLGELQLLGKVTRADEGWIRLT